MCDHLAQPRTHWRPPPQLRPIRQLHNLEPRRRTLRTVFARPTSLTLDFERFPAQCAISLHQHELSLPNSCTVDPLRGEREIGGQVPGFRAQEKTGFSLPLSLCDHVDVIVTTMIGMSSRFVVSVMSVMMSAVIRMMVIQYTDVLMWSGVGPTANDHRWIPTRQRRLVIAVRACRGARFDRRRRRRRSVDAGRPHSSSLNHRYEAPHLGRMPRAAASRSRVIHNSSSGA